MEAHWGPTLNLVSFNVRGSKVDTALICKLLDLYFLVLTETWMYDEEVVCTPGGYKSIHVYGD